MREARSRSACRLAAVIFFLNSIAARPFPSPKKEVAVDPKIFDRYAGDYELTPGFTITILRRGDKLISQATGQPEVELFPEHVLSSIS
jgi:hypothetical protein